MRRQLKGSGRTGKGSGLRIGKIDWSDSTGRFRLAAGVERPMASWYGTPKIGRCVYFVHQLFKNNTKLAYSVFFT